MQTDEIRFESVRAFPLVSALTGLTAIAMLAVSIAQNQPGLGWAAVLPACLSVAGITWRPRTVHGVITDQGIRMVDTDIEIPFGTDVRIRAIGRNPRKPLKRFAIHVEHGRQSFVIPRRLDTRSEHLFQAILQRLPSHGSDHVAPFLEDYYHRQMEMFGPDLVFATSAFMGRAKEPGSGGPMKAWGIGGLFAGFVYILAAIVTPENARFHDELLGFGSMFIVLALVLFAIASASPGYTLLVRRAWTNSGVVIGPVGLAMVQGEIRGELTWNQLLDVVYRSKASHFRLQYQGTTGPGIILKVEGARITIADIYDRPLDVMHKHIMKNWRPDFVDAGV